MQALGEFKVKKREILPILHICNKIKSLKLQWENYNQILNDVRRSVKISKKMVADDYYARKVELCYITLLSGIDNLNEILKKNFYKKIKKLQTFYTPITANKLDKWSQAMRNSLIHGDFHMFGFIFFEGNLFNNKQLINCEGLDVICDYSIVDEMPRFNNLNKEKYFLDEIIVMLRLLYNKNLRVEDLEKLGKLNYLDEEIKLRTNREISIQNITHTGNISELLKNNDFITYHYKNWKKHAVDPLGQFHFNIAMLIKEIYHQHLTYFENAYNTLCTIYNTEIKNFMDIQLQVKKIAEAKDSPLDFSFMINFSLECVKPIF